MKINHHGYKKQDTVVYMQRQTIEVENLLICLCRHKIVTNDHAKTWTKDNLTMSCAE